MPAADVKIQDVTSESPRERIMPQLNATNPTNGPKPKRWIKRYRTEVCAGSASVLSTLTAFPLDSVKTRLQTYPYAGFTDCVRSTYQKEGLHGFFRGMWLERRPEIDPHVRAEHIRYWTPMLTYMASTRRDGTAGQRDSCAHHLIFDISTLKIRLLGLDGQAFGVQPT